MSEEQKSEILNQMVKLKVTEAEGERLLDEVIEEHKAKFKEKHPDLSKEELDKMMLGLKESLRGPLSALIHITDLANQSREAGLNRVREALLKLQDTQKE